MRFMFCVTKLMDRLPPLPHQSIRNYNSMIPLHHTVKTLPPHPESQLPESNN